LNSSREKEETLAIAINNLDSSALEIKVQGRVGKSDYERFVPLAEDRIKTHGHLNLLVDITDMRGYSLPALWEDLKFDVKHYKDISRLALVGEDSSKSWLATLSKPFTAADVEFYPLSEIHSARDWVTGSARSSQ
jgi:hypothetical protein